jgi:hypothetical protein
MVLAYWRSTLSTSMQITKVTHPALPLTNKENHLSNPKQNHLNEGQTDRPRISPSPDCVQRVETLQHVLHDWGHNLQVIWDQLFWLDTSTQFQKTTFQGWLVPRFPKIIFNVQREFEHKANWVNIFMLLHLPAWMMKWIIFLAIWRVDVVKVVFIYLLNVHQQVRPKSVSPYHPSPRKDCSSGKQFQSKIYPLSWNTHPTITPE